MPMGSDPFSRRKTDLTPQFHSTLTLLLQVSAALPNTAYSGKGACIGSMRPSPRVIFLNSARLTDT